MDSYCRHCEARSEAIQPSALRNGWIASLSLAKTNSTCVTGQGRWYDASGMNFEAAEKATLG